ncbi:hypothetical protein PFISCL1PPCAC_7569, partial [Pristionchus fissidentatus]
MHKLIPHHTHIVQFHQAWIEDTHLYMKIELCDNSLEGYWEEQITLNQDDLMAVLKDALLALVHLNSHNIAHLDIKEGNIMRTKEGLYKLGDFSVTADLTKDKKDREFGEGIYAAPEVLQHIITFKADIFSLGITLALV